MQLVYRGQTFEYSVKSIQPHYQHRAINWRYQVTQQSCISSSLPAFHIRQPLAINWRFRMAAEG